MSRFPVVAPAIFALSLSTHAGTAPPSSVGDGSATDIVTHDNRQQAGRLQGTRLQLDLIADVGRWRPEGPSGPSYEIAAFGEVGGPLSVPGPLVRVSAGTTVSATLRNSLDSALRVHGLCARPGPCSPASIPPGEVFHIEFVLDAPGTYHYWAATTAAAVGGRNLRDAQLGGVIVVDATGSQPPSDRVFALTEYAAFRTDDEPVLAINGRSWPHTERLELRLGQPERWRIVNIGAGHAMHLHGFPYVVETVGDGLVDRELSADERRTVVTERVPAGGTYAMRWTPERTGNWLFHCHMSRHMAPSHPPGRSRSHDHARDEADRTLGMGGLVLGLHVTGDAADEGTTPTAAVPLTSAAPRRFTLAVSKDPSRYDDGPGFRFEIEGTETRQLDDGPVPGPVVALTRGEPVEVTIVNRMDEPTAVHWHGLELESRYDGVPGWSGVSGSVTPAVEAGGITIARFTPPRAGTFIYHTHWHDDRQLAGGLYGPLIVLEPGQRFDPETDHIVMIGLNGVTGPDRREPFALNGRARPAPIEMRAGVPNRLRLVNITANNVGLRAFVIDRLEPTRWTPISKDGIRLPAAQAVERPAVQAIGVGETYDFQITPKVDQRLWLEVRRGGGEWVLQAPIVIRDPSAPSPEP